MWIVFVACWWFQTFFSFHNQLGCHPSQLTNSYFSEGKVYHQPIINHQYIGIPLGYIYISLYISLFPHIFLWFPIVSGDIQHIDYHYSYPDPLLRGMGCEPVGNPSGWHLTKGGVLSHGGIPIAGWFIMDNPMKMGDSWGYPNSWMVYTTMDNRIKMDDTWGYPPILGKSPSDPEISKDHADEHWGELGIWQEYWRPAASLWFRCLKRWMPTSIWLARKLLLCACDEHDELVMIEQQPAFWVITTPLPIGSMVLLYMVLHGSHQYTPVMLAFFYQHR